MTARTRSIRFACHVAALLAVGAAPLHAIAQNISLPFKATYKGSVELTGYALNGCTQLYTVPAGQTLRITDYAVGPYIANGSAIPFNSLCSGTPACSATRTALFILAPNSVVTYNSTTGFKFNAGETLSICNSSNISYAAWTLTGFLYTSP